MIYIILCTYNGEKYIKEQLQSIADSIENDWNIVISDDQSADSTIKIAEEFQEKYSNKIVIKRNKEKKGAVRNFLSTIYELGQTISSDDFIMLCDQDDVWYADKMYKTMEGMRELIHNYGSNIPLLVCTDVTVVDDELKPISQSFRKMNHYSIRKLDFSHLMMENKVQGCTVMVNKSMALMLERIPARASMHDCWLALTAAAFGKIKYIDEPTMKYRQHTDNVKGSIEYREDIKNKFSNLRGQRSIVMDTTAQMREFLDIYGDRLSTDIKRQAAVFATLPQQNFFVRRYHIIKYHMWKSGILRNIGLMVLI